MSYNNIEGAVGGESDDSGCLFRCQICSSALTKNEEISVNNCGHVFHMKCIQQWINQSNICPQCRAKNPNPTKIYLDCDDGGTIENKMMNEQKVMLESANYQLSICNYQLKTSEAMVDSMQTEMHNLQSQLKEREAYVESLKTELYKLQNELLEAKKSEDNLKNIFEESQIWIDSANIELINRERQLKEKNVLLDSLTTELNRIRQKFNMNIENKIETSSEIRVQSQEKGAIPKIYNSKLEDEKVTKVLANEIFEIGAYMKQSKVNENIKFDEKEAIENKLDEKLKEIQLVLDQNVSTLNEIRNTLTEVHNQSKNLDEISETKCKHVYHMACLTNLLECYKKCPANPQRDRDFLKIFQNVERELIEIVKGARETQYLILEELNEERLLNESLTCSKNLMLGKLRENEQRTNQLQCENQELQKILKSNSNEISPQESQPIPLKRSTFNYNNFHQET